MRASRAPHVAPQLTPHHRSLVQFARNSSGSMWKELAPSSHVASALAVGQMQGDSAAAGAAPPVVSLYVAIALHCCLCGYHAAPPRARSLGASSDARSSCRRLVSALLARGSPRHDVEEEMVHSPSHKPQLRRVRPPPPAGYGAAAAPAPRGSSAPLPAALLGVRRTANQRERERSRRAPPRSARPRADR